MSEPHGASGPPAASPARCAVPFTERTMGGAISVIEPFDRVSRQIEDRGRPRQCAR